jgi:hypothetical protein
MADMSDGVVELPEEETVAEEDGIEQDATIHEVFQSFVVEAKELKQVLRFLLMNGISHDQYAMSHSQWQRRQRKERIWSGKSYWQ